MAGAPTRTNWYDVELVFSKVYVESCLLAGRHLDGNLPIPFGHLQSRYAVPKPGCRLVP